MLHEEQIQISTVSSKSLRPGRIFAVYQKLSRTEPQIIKTAGLLHL